MFKHESTMQLAIKDIWIETCIAPIAHVYDNDSLDSVLWFKAKMGNYWILLGVAFNMQSLGHTSINYYSTILPSKLRVAFNKIEVNLGFNVTISLFSWLCVDNC